MQTTAVPIELEVKEKDSLNMMNLTLNEADFAGEKTPRTEVSPPNAAFSISQLGVLKRGAALMVPGANRKQATSFRV